MRSRTGNRNTNAYVSWYCMKSRCNNPNNKGYSLYGGRGVAYCDRWESFDNFFEDMGERPDGYQLDKDKKGGIGCKLYSPENCCWISADENNKFRRPTSGLSAHQYETIFRLLDEGHSILEIHRITGHPRGSLYRIRNRRPLLGYE